MKLFNKIAQPWTTNWSIISGHSASISFFLFLVFFLITARGNIRGLDETVMYSTMVNVWERHTFAIDELSYLHEKVGIGSYGAGGHLYSKLPIGNMLFAIWLYGLGEAIIKGAGMVFASLTNSILSAIGMLLLFIFLKKRFRPSTAIIVTVLIGICSDWWYETRGFGSEIGAGVFLLASLVAADQRLPFASSLSFGISILFRPLNLLAAPVWILNAVHHRSRQGLFRVMLSGSVIGAILVCILVYNGLRFGNLFNFGYQNEKFSTPLLQGLLYLFFSPGRSIFLYSPIFLFAFAGSYLWIKKDRTMAFVLITSVVIYLVSIATWKSWDGGWSWGSRLLTPVVPLIGVLIAPVIENWGDRISIRILIGMAALIGLGIGILALLQDPLLTMQNQVMFGRIPYEETVFTLHHSFLALQIAELRSWQVGTIDSFFLRMILLLAKLLFK